jgi:hypothetical protein
MSRKLVIQCVLAALILQFANAEIRCTPGDPGCSIKVAITPIKVTKSRRSNSDHGSSSRTNKKQKSKSHHSFKPAPAPTHIKAPKPTNCTDNPTPREYAALLKQYVADNFKQPADDCDPEPEKSKEVLDPKLQAIQTFYEKLRATLSTTILNTLALTNDNANLKKQQEALLKRLELLNPTCEKAEEIQKQLKKAETIIEELRAQIEGSKDSQNYKQQYMFLISKISQYEATIQSLNEEAAALKNNGSQKESTEAKLKEVMEEVRKLQAELESVNKKLRFAASRIHKGKSERSHYSSKSRRAIVVGTSLE